MHYLAIVCLRISLLEKTRRVVPIAVHLFRKTPLNTVLKLGSDDKTFLEFNCLSCVLGTINAQEHLESKNVMARLCLPLMAYDPEDKNEVLAGSVNGLYELIPGEPLRSKYLDFITYYAPLEKEEKKEFFEKWISKSPYKEEIMTWAQLNEVEKAESRAEGEQAGEVKGKINLLLELIQSGIITREHGRERIESIAKEGLVSQEFVKQVLEKCN